MQIATIKKFIAQLLVLSGAFLFHNSALALAPPNSMQALSQLLEGNNHFVKGEMKHLSLAAEAKNKLLENQTPFAVIVCCSDSRVPPEIIFDQGLGELFVVRVAGNVIGPIEMNSVEYAVDVLDVPLVMVMGHQNCGAVKGALVGDEDLIDLSAIFPLINDAIKTCEGIGGNSLTNAINCNVKKGVDTLKNSSIIAPLVDQKKVRIVGAYFNFETGKVSLTTE